MAWSDDELRIGVLELFAEASNSDPNSSPYWRAAKERQAALDRAKARAARAKWDPCVAASIRRAKNKYARKAYYETRSNPEKWAAKLAQLREYKRQRYHSDPEYRARHLAKTAARRARSKGGCDGSAG